MKQMVCDQCKEVIRIRVVKYKIVETRRSLTSGTEYKSIVHFCSSKCLREFVVKEMEI